MSNTNDEQKARARLTTCPRCGGRVVPILYGELEGDGLGLVLRGRAAIGGCCIGRPGGDPDRRCKGCGTDFLNGEAVP